MGVLLHSFCVPGWQILPRFAVLGSLLCAALLYQEQQHGEALRLVRTRPYHGLLCCLDF
jgi:hypothetical protein